MHQEKSALQHQRCQNPREPTSDVFAHSPGRAHLGWKVSLLMPRHVFPVFQQQFEVDQKYTLIREIGQGAYGVVCAAKNIETRSEVAIKKVIRIFEKTILAKRALREIKLLRHFSGHENVRFYAETRQVYIWSSRTKGLRLTNSYKSAGIVGGPITRRKTVLMRKTDTCMTRARNGRWRILGPILRVCVQVDVQNRCRRTGGSQQIIITRFWAALLLSSFRVADVHVQIHKNVAQITSLLDIDIVDPQNFNEIYLMQDLMEADLHQIIRSEQPLTDSHYQYFVYQVCRGLKYIHSANVLHRDLKPGNLLVNADCELKICDFGLARGFSNAPEENAGFMTEYVATRWYRAPDIMLSFQSYTKAIDVWSVGCIFAEMLGGKPLFKGRDYVDQLNQILGILGTPDDETLRRIGSERAQVYIRSLPVSTKVPFSKLYPKASALALDLLERLLQFDPARRITVDEVLRHPYLATYHDETDEPTHPQPFDFSFETAEGMDVMRKMITEEVFSFRQSRAHASAPQHAAKGLP